MSFLRGYQNQKRIIYFIMFLVMAFPVLHPIGLPIAISQPTKDFLNAIDDLPAGSVVMAHYGGDAASWGELQSQVEDVTQYLMTRPLKVIYFSTWPMGSQFVDKALKAADKHGKVYGVDYVNIGYVAGWDTGLAALASNLHGVVQVDYYGNSIAGTFLDNVNSGKDVALCIAFECGSCGSSSFLNVFQAHYGTKVLSGAIGVMVPGVIPYYATGQISGYLNSIRGAGEFEVLTHSPGLGVISTDVLSTSHLWLIISVIIGNIVYFTGKEVKSNDIRTFWFPYNLLYAVNIQSALQGESILCVCGAHIRRHGSGFRTSSRNRIYH